MVGYGGLLAEFAFTLVVEAIAVGVVVGALRQVAELVELEPIHDTVGVAVLGALHVMGDDLAGLVDVHVDRAAGHPGRACLTHPVDRPVGKIVPVGFAMEVGGGEGGIHLEKGVGFADESRRVALDRGPHHCGVGEDEAA